MTNYVWTSNTWQYINGQPTIIIFARDVDTKKTKKFIVKGFKPYYYMADDKGNLTSCFGDPIRKVVCRVPSDVSAQRNTLKAEGIETYEADILFETRFMYDKKIVYGFNERLEPVDVGLLKPRVVYYDIEVAIPEGDGIDPERNKYPIVAISVRDSYTGKTKVFTARSGKKTHRWEVVSKDESGVINGFLDYIRDTDPDIITGWYNINFDMPYILGRANVNNIDVSRLARVGTSITAVDRIAGRTHIDMLEFFKDWSKPMGQFQTYDLKFISKNFANFAYEDHGEHITRLIERDDWKTLVQYSGNDVEALARIDEKAGLITYHENLRRICGIKFESTIKRTHIIETLLIRHGIKPIPNRQKRDGGTFEGAVVLQPPVGTIDNVIFLDAKSLYPSIIIAFDLSPDIDKMIPKTITYILNEREKYRKLKMDGKASETDEVTEQSLKYIANSFYGAMGSPIFKLYDRKIAAFITEKGREINALIQSVVKREGYNIIYGDTDSVAVASVPSIEEGIRLEGEVNAELLKWARAHEVKDEFAPVVKFEKFFKKMFFKKRTSGDGAAKKKYVGHLIWKDGKVKDEISYTGIEIKRSDTAPITKECMETFFHKVLIEGDVDGAVSDVKTAYRNVSRGHVLSHAIAIPKAVHSKTVNSPHVKGMAAGTLLMGIRFDASKKPRLLYCKSPYKEVCIDDNVDESTIRSKVTIDYEKMADRVIAQKMRSLVESLGVDWGEATHGQKKLDFGDEDV